MRSLALLAFPVVPMIVFAACGGGNKPTGWPQPPTDASPEGSMAQGGEAGTADIEQTIGMLATKVAPDMQKEGAFVRQTIAPGQHTKVDVSLKGDECYTIIAFAQGVGDLDMAMLYKDPTSGQLTPIAQDGQTDMTAVLGVPPTPICPPKASDVVLDLSAKSGGGNVGIGLYAKTNPQVHPVNPTAGDPTDELMKKNSAALAKGMQPEGNVMKQTLKEGETFPFTVTLSAGRCYTVVAVSPKDGVSDIDLKMLMPPFYTMEVERDKRTDNVAVVGPQCPITIFPVPYRMDVTAKKGSGPVAVQLFSKAK